MGNSSSQEEDSKKHRFRSTSSSTPRARSSSRSRQSEQSIDKLPSSLISGGPGAKAGMDAARVQKRSVLHNTSTGTTSVVDTGSTEPCDELIAPVPQDEHATNASRPAFVRRKSTILLEDQDMDDRLVQSDEGNLLSRTGSGEEIDLRPTANKPTHDDEEDTSGGTNPNTGDNQSHPTTFDTVLYWSQGGSKVYITGSFTGWMKMIKMHKQDDGIFYVVLKLPMGTHRLRFVVDNELRCSDDLPTATDSMGNLVNYIQVGEISEGSNVEHQPYEVDHQGLRDDGGSSIAVGGDVSENASSVQMADEANASTTALGVASLSYVSEIPAVFTDPEVMDRFVSSNFVTPPQLPPHLEGVILNSNSTEKDNNSVLPIPNHVVLNHLATTSIKHNVLAVASITRYSGKYVTQILYAPL